MREFQIDDSDISIKEANKEDLIDLNLCAKEFLQLIEDFNINFLNRKYFTLTAYYKKLLVGILVAEEKNHKVDSLEKIVPKTNLYLIFVNPNFRKNHIGKKILINYLTIQKKKGIASIFVELPHKYKKGIQFFQYNKFHQINKVKDKIILEINLWNDFGIRSSEFIANNLSDVFN